MNPFTFPLHENEEINIKAVYNLINNGDINKKYNTGSTLISFAAAYAQIKIVRILAENGAMLDLQDDNGMTALIIASAYNHQPEYRNIVDFLIKNMSDIDIQDNNGMTALMHAAWHGCSESLSLLLHGGADINLKDEQGRSAYDLAIEANQIETIYYLNPDAINAKDENGSTLIMRACEEENEYNILFLYDKGADFYLKDTYGESAIDILQNLDNLSTKLQALKEKLMLEFISNNDNNYSLSL